ncbi:MAG TPA: hypothetical protein VNI54_10810 [Thermoanaerobaculia bacterium]|nr:hypothetical protein [Thermoanaerobaculia bacterium]
MRRTGSLFLFLFFAATAAAHDIPKGDLAALGRIWGIINYAHPWMGYRDVDLDALTLEAIGRVRAGARVGVAVDEILRELGDDASHVTRVCYSDDSQTAARPTRLIADGVVYLNSDDAQARTLLKTARSAVVDLRPQPGRCSATYFANALEPLLVRGTIAYPRHRKTRHYGYRSQGEASTDFDSSFRLIDLGSIKGESTTLMRVVFITDERSAIPAVATALADAGQAVFVSVGTFPLHTAVDHCQMGLGDGSIVTLRTSELIDKDGYSAEPAPMITLAANAPENDVIAAAVQLAKPRGSGRRRASSMSSAPLADYAWQADARFATAAVPPVEERIFAAYRLWNVMEFFHGARDWDVPLGDVVSLLENATTRRDYELALAEVVRLHGVVEAPAVRELHGAAAPPFELLQIEEKPVVVASSSEQVKAGDELLRIDGVDVSVRLNILERYTSPAIAVRDLAKGAANTNPKFTFRRADGSQYEVSLARGTTAPAPNATRILDGNIAYVDLRGAQDVDYNAIAATNGMILDLRGSSLNTSIAKRLNTTGLDATVSVPVLLGGASNVSDTAQRIADDELPNYAGRTIALVDARTDYRTALMFRALARTKLLGTAGAATAAFSQLVVPGNILIRFGASGLASAEPEYDVEPTIRGLAGGRDEQLEAAQAILK